MCVTCTSDCHTVNVTSPGVPLHAQLLTRTAQRIGLFPTRFIVLENVIVEDQPDRREAIRHVVGEGV